MDMPDLTIEFHGICTHFRNTVPAVPHRVVLPQTSPWRPGRLSTPEHPAPAPYMLAPHLASAYVKVGKEVQPLDVPGAIENGWILAPLRLRIVNASDPVLKYPSRPRAPEVRFDRLPPLGEYATNYRYSGDVVFGGRVQCYFDLSRGTVVGQLYGEALGTVARMNTDGQPRLHITRLARHFATEPFFDEVPLPPGSTLVIANANVHCKDADLDFLWHLLTAEGSIPQHLPKNPYGYDGAVPGIDRDELTSRFARLLADGYPGPGRGVEMTPAFPI